MAYPTNSLPQGFILKSPHHEYIIERELGSGGFGITYLAYTFVHVGNVKVKVSFAIKEHFLGADCERENGTYRVIYSNPAANRVERSRKDFYSEANRLRKLSNMHSNLVCVNEVFEANNTVYYVMEYLNGETLRSFVKKNGRLSEQMTKELIMPVVDVVDFIHSERITHLDIKPDNIMLVSDEDGRLKPVLIDFGLAKHYDVDGNPTSTINITGYSRGYAPIEQYAGLTTFSPESDIYSIGATICFCLTGETPPESIHIKEGALACALPPDVSNSMRNMIFVATRRFDREMPRFGVKTDADERTMWGDGASWNSPRQDDSEVELEEDKGETVRNAQPQSATKVGLEEDMEDVSLNEVTPDKVKKYIKLAVIIIALAIMGYLAKQFFDNERPHIDISEVAGDEEIAPVESLYDANGVSFSMVMLHGGEFTMGTDAANAESWEKPAHAVKVSNFEIGSTEVSQELWKAVMGSNPSHFKGDDLPVENVSWDDCQEFIRRLNIITGETFRLPYEDEWEYAARGGARSGENIYSGSDVLDAVGWYAGNSDGRTHAVYGTDGKLVENEVGLFDMSGNVWEWTQNRWSPDYSQPAGADRVCRGGGFSSQQEMCRVTYRRNHPANYHDVNLGFRLAK